MAQEMMNEDEMPMRGMSPDTESQTEDQSEGGEESGEKPMIYLTQEQLGTPCKVGDTVTLKATDVDPESGEVSFEIQDWNKGGASKQSGGYEADFESAMPAEEGEQ